MAKRRYSKKITKKRVFKLTPKEAETIINEEFMTPKGYKMRKQFIFKFENPNESGIKVYYNHDKEQRYGNGTN